MGDVPDFRSFLDETRPMEAEAGGSAADRLWQALPAGFLADFQPAARSEGRGFVAEAYLDALMLAAGADDPGAAPPTDAAAVSTELGLHACRDERDLDRARRVFALRNHPDRVPEAYRAAAMLRMQEANRMIDDAKRALRLRHA